MRSWVVCLLAAVALIFAPAARPDVVGSVRGIVHDPQHRPILGASVRLRAANSTWSQSAQTSADGEFTFPAVPVGAYTLIIRARNFETTKESIEVMVNS
ncbi:MAG: carboxypeptidase regulatory-like domain-containing protein, partial [Acidobacteriota bacterium]|nr:carboxypeptidase regulatory-like domain-containing protein [Acidobacteriota bacterium]